MMRRLLRSIASAFGATTICCLWIIGPLIVPSHDAIYHWTGPANTIFVPAAIDFVGVLSLFSFLLFLAQGEKRGAIILWTGIYLFLPWITLKSFALFMNWDLPHWISRSLFVLCTVLFILFSTYLRSDHLAALERLRKRSIDFLCIVALSGVVMLVQLAWFAWQAQGLDAPPTLHHTANTNTQIRVKGPRFVWIILDELSYRQVYEHRFHTLNLPAFDRLAKESLVFTNVAPAGLMTEIVVPSFITGLPLDKIQPSSNGFGLKIHNSVTNEWKAFDQHDTIFNDALAAGYSTGIAGWYNPYCRILPEVLDQCFWVWGQPGTNKMLPRASIEGNVFNPILLNSSFLNHLASVVTRGRVSEAPISEAHLSDYQQISNSADELLKKPDIDFVLIHMAVPHPGGIYSRAAHSLTTRGATYIDNLALADLYLAHVRSLLEAERQWDSSAIVVMGDHSWRTKGYAASPDWAIEEKEASDGGLFDDRPGYIVKLPDQKVGTTVSTQFPAFCTRKLFGAIMMRQIASHEDLLLWLKTVNCKHPDD